MPLLCIFVFLDSIYGVFGYIFQFVLENNAEWISRFLPPNVFVRKSVFLITKE